MKSDVTAHCGSFFCALFLCVVSCRSAGQGVSAGDRLITTDSSQFHATPTQRGSAVRIAATLRNNLPYPLYIVRCQDSALFALDKKIAQSWKTAWETVCLLNERVVDTVAPGRSYRDVRVVEHGPSYSGFEISDLEGQYRARYGIFSRYGRDPGTGKHVTELAPESARVTNEFMILRR